MVKYKILNQTHPDYDELGTRKLQLLYEGGQSIISNASLFIPKENLESMQAYQNRLQCSSYKNYLSEIINSYTAEVFAKTLTVLPAADADDPSTAGTNIETTDDFYQQFAENADLKGNSLVNLLKCLLSESTTTGRAYLSVDFPKPDAIPASLLDEEKLGNARAYLLPIPTLSVIDWNIDDTSGTYTFLVLKSEYMNRTSLEGQRLTKIIRFKIWEKQNNGLITWKIYELEIKANKQPKPDDDFPLVDEGSVSFQEIPIICLECPKELWVGNLVGSLCSDHFKRYSSLVYAENRNLFSIPVYQQGAELTANGDLSEITDNVHRGVQAAAQMRIKGFAVTGPEDKIYFAEPDGRAYELVDKQLAELVDEIHRVTHLMANSISNRANANTTSGVSKLLDNRSKEIVLTAYGEVIKAYVIKIYSLISKARSEYIVWAALGLDDYKLTMDRDQLLKEATSISLINVPSNTFKKAMLTQVATQFLNSLTPQEQLVIKDEISKSVDSGKADELYADQTNPDGSPASQSNLPAKSAAGQQKTDNEKEEATLEMAEYEEHPEQLLPDDVLTNIHIKQLGTINEFIVWSVNGKMVRNVIYLDFVEGGNPGRYRFVPEEEIWVEEWTEPTELAPIILHEITEAIEMKAGASYDEAHSEANIQEMICRQAMSAGLIKKTDPIEIVKDFLKNKEEEQEAE